MYGSSTLVMVPGSINSKKVARVKVIQEWDRHSVLAPIYRPTVGNLNEK